MVKIKRKIICAIATADKNENIDLWLTIADKKVAQVLEHNQTLVTVFSKQMKKSGTISKSLVSEMVTMQDFDKIKVIGKGGFAEKVYLARKKDTGSLYAIKTMSKDFIMEE